MVDRLFDACPWWRIQTLASLTPFVLEEAREVTAALEALSALPGPPSPEISSHLGEELGDLLLQVLTLAKVAELEHLGTLADVLEALAAKLERRHPHVFGDACASTPEEAGALYAAAKRQERRQVHV